MTEFELNNNFKENVFEHFEDGESNFLPSVEQSMQLGQMLSQAIVTGNQIYQDVKPRKENKQLAQQMQQQYIAQQQQQQQQKAKEQQMYSLLAQAKQKSSEKTKNRNKLIIGLSIGGSVLLLATILIIYVKRKK